LPEIKDIIEYVIAVIGLITVGIFGFAIWSVAKKSLDMAEASYRLAEQLADIQIEKETSGRNSFRRGFVIARVDPIIKQLKNLNQISDIHEIITLSAEPRLSYEELGRYFSAREAALIKEAWTSLSKYLSDYWLNMKGEPILFASDNVPGKYEEAEKVAKKFERLKELLESKRKPLMEEFEID